MSNAMSDRISTRYQIPHTYDTTSHLTCQIKCLFVHQPCLIVYQSLKLCTKWHLIWLCSFQKIGRYKWIVCKTNYSFVPTDLFCIESFRDFVFTLVHVQTFMKCDMTHSCIACVTWLCTCYRVAKTRKMPYTMQVIFCKRATNYRAIFRKMTYTDKASYDSTPPCTWDVCTTPPNLCMYMYLCAVTDE